MRPSSDAETKALGIIEESPRGRKSDDREAWRLHLNIHGAANSWSFFFISSSLFPFPFHSAYLDWDSPNQRRLSKIPFRNASAISSERRCELPVRNL